MNTLIQCNYDDAERARSALYFLPPPLSREEWLQLLMAAHAAGVSEDEARMWSECGENFDESDFRSTWRSIKLGAVTAGTLFRAALDAGWNAPPHGRRLSVADRTERDAERAKQREQAVAKRAAREIAAAAHATKIWNEAEPADNHAYLTRKGVRAHGLKIGKWEKVDPHTGEVRVISEQALLIKLRDMQNNIHSLQAIFPSEDNVLGRDRDYLAGGAKQGNFFDIGEPQIVDGKKLIVIVEGYSTGASVYECTGHAVVIAFDKSNLEPVARVIRGRLPNAEIVIISDRDAEVLAESGGTKMALKAALATGARIVVPEWCGLNGRDANDIHRNGFTWCGTTYPGTEILKDCVRFATPFRSAAFMEMLRECGIEAGDLVAYEVDGRRQADSQQYDAPPGADAAPKSQRSSAPAAEAAAMVWAEPVDPFGVHKPPTVPMDVLPSAIAAYAADQASLMGVDPAFIAMPALVAAASVIHDGITLQPKRKDPTWVESARLWVALVGDPSTLKSPAIGKATRHVRRLDAKLAEQNEAEYAQWRERHDEWKTEKKKNRDAPEPKAPVKRRMVVEDATTEALSEVLKDNERGILCLRDELAGWLGSMDAYKGGGGQDRAAWLEAFNGGPRTVDRVQRGSFRVPNWSVCMIGGIQPDTIRRHAGNMGSDGLLQRFMPIIATPVDAIGEDRTPDRSAMDQFGALFDQLAGIKPGPQAVTMTEAAHQARERVDHHRKKMSAAFDNDHMRAWLGKWSGLFARLVLTYHVIECAGGGVHPTAREVSGETAGRVERLLCGTLLHHAIHFYADVIDAHDRQEHIRQLARLILAHGMGRVTNRDIQRLWKAARRLQTWEVRAAVEGLVAMGWLEPDAADLGIDGKPRSWDVNPRTHEAFAQLAEHERARRKEIVKTLLALKATYSAGRDTDQEAGD